MKNLFTLLPYRNMSSICNLVNGLITMKYISMIFFFVLGHTVSAGILMKKNTAGFDSGCPANGKSTPVLSDSIKRRYLVCESRGDALNRSRIYRDGDHLTVWDTLGRQAIGRLKVLNGEKFVITGAHRSRDTFNIGAIGSIRNSIHSKSAGANFSLTLGSSFTLMGLASIAGDNPSSSSGGLMTLNGIGLTIVGIPLGIIGLVLPPPKMYKRDNYIIRIIQTKGFKLKPSYIPHL